ncbi:MAG: DUF1134 domain-containing protein [Pseudomonadota bacterium]
MIRFLTLLLATLLLAMPLGPDRARAAECTIDDFAKAVDEAGVKLRAFNQANAAKLRSKMQRLKEKRGWQDADYESRAMEAVHDVRVAEMTQRADELLSAIDTLGQPPAGAPPDCRKLAELKKATGDLLELLQTKSTYLLAKLDGELGQAPPAAKAAEGSAGKTAPPAAPAPTASAPRDDAHRPDAAPAPKRESWQTTTALEPSAAPPPDGTGTARTPPSATGAENEGYTIEEIRDATRGFFGTISTNLATVLEHAFASYGRPTGYVLGQEGGGAFLAGLRYGSGTLYMRKGAERPIYWHGPSLGYDFGAEGSRTMFLIYKLADPEALFRRFTGIDGSAYLVGGVGITFLKGGDVIMAPIRSGLGLRLGANVGYVRFTPRATWNPF